MTSIKPYNLRVIIHKNSTGYCDFESFEELENLQDIKDFNKLQLMNVFHYTDAVECVEYLVSLKGKDHFFINLDDAIEFIRENTPER